MLSVIRFAGVTIAAVWFGGAAFFTFFVASAFFTESMKELLPAPYNGEVVQRVFHRYFALHYIFGTLALAHLGFEWIYSGRTVRRLTLALVGGTLCLALFGGMWLQPKLEQMHQMKYAEQYQVQVSAGQRALAARSFNLWHGISQVLNLVMLAALWGNLWRAMHSGEAPMYLGGTKFNIDKRL